MAKTMGMEVLEQKIEKAQENVVKTKKKYDTATAALKQLLDKKQAMQMEEVISAIVKSNRSYEEILNYINMDPEVSDEE